MTITVSDMRAKLLTLDEVHDQLGRSEPLATHNFTVGDAVRFTIDDDWHHQVPELDGTDPVKATVELGHGPGRVEHRLTKDALLEATSVCGISKTYAARCPGPLLQPHLNYWFREGLATKAGHRDYQLLSAGGNGAAITRSSIVPFSNLRLLDEAVDGIRKHFGAGTEILADYKFTHSLRRTHLRLIVPATNREITGTGTDDDTWCLGLQLKNSLTGELRTSIDGYLFRWVCTNGAIDTHATSGAWTRRGQGAEDEVYEWARSAVDEVLGGLEGSLDAVQEMVTIPIEGHVNDVLRDVFEYYRVPLPERARIIEALIEAGGPITMYTVMAAITQVANDTSMDPAHVENLLRMGGDLPHAATSRCDACQRLLPH